MTQGIPINIEDGKRFVRLTVLSVFGHRALVLCDCGEVITCTKSNLFHGNTKSCGCWRVDNSRQKGIKDSPAQTRRGWEEGWWDREQARKQAIENAKAQRGVEAEGLAAKGPDNIRAKWYAVRSPNNVVLEGKNLSHLVRANAHMFADDDVKWTKNEWGTDKHCRAMIGLRSLFRQRSRPSKSWKGWTKV